MPKYQSETNRVPVEVDLNQSLSHLQALTAQLHRYCEANNPGGEEAYHLLLALKGMAGNEAAASPSYSELQSIMSEIRSIVGTIQHSDIMMQNDELRASMDQYLELLAKVTELFLSSSQQKRRKGVSRRSFLLMAMASLTAGVWGTYRAANHIPPINRGEISGFDELVANIEYVKQRHGLDIYTSLPLSNPFSLSGERPTFAEMEKTVSGIRVAADFYPPGYFIRNGISGVTLLKNLRHSGKEVGGLAVATHGYFAMSIMNAPAEVISRAFHHEAYHMTDLRLSIQNLLTGEDEQRHADWVNIYACNCNVYDSLYVLNRDTFARKYSHTSATEDRADMGSYLLTRHFHHELLQRIATMTNIEDRRILETKIQQIKSHYLEWSNGQMDDQYWEDLLADRISADYFG